MTADASVLLLLSFVNATFRVEIKWCLFLCVLRATCIFRKDYFRKQCICCKVWFRFEKTHRMRKKCPKNLSVTMLRWMVFFTRTWEKFGWTFRALSLPLHSFHRQKPTEKLNLHLRPMKHHFGGGWHFRSPVLAGTLGLRYWTRERIMRTWVQDGSLRNFNLACSPTSRSSRNFWPPLVLTFVISYFFSANDIAASWAPFVGYHWNSDIIADLPTLGFKPSRPAMLPPRPLA